MRAISGEQMDLLEIHQNLEYRSKSQVTAEDVDLWLNTYYESGFKNLKEVGPSQLQHDNHITIYPFVVAIKSKFLEQN